MRRLEDDGRRADRWLQRSNRASSGLSQVENRVHVLTVCRAPRRPGQACYHHQRPQNPAAYADLVKPDPCSSWTPLTSIAISYRSSRKAGTASAKRHTSSRTTAGRDLSSVQPRRRSSESQVVTAQLVDGSAAHQLHVAFDFGSEIFKRAFNAGFGVMRFEERQITYSMRYDLNLTSWRLMNGTEEFAAFFRHDDLGRSIDDSAHHVALDGRGLGKDGVKCGHDRHFEARYELDDIPAGLTAEDSVFVLKRNNMSNPALFRNSAAST